MNAKRVTAKMISILNEDVAQEILPVDGLNSFEDAGVLTSDNGFVLRLQDGSEYQITVVQSRQSRS